jgi:hypothetical protein
MTLQKNLTLLNLNFLNIFYVKKINSRYRAGHVTSKFLNNVNLNRSIGHEFVLSFKEHQFQKRRQN